MNVCEKRRVEYLHLGIQFLDWAEVVSRVDRNRNKIHLVFCHNKLPIDFEDGTCGKHHLPLMPLFYDLCAYITGVTMH